MCDKSDLSYHPCILQFLSLCVTSHIHTLQLSDFSLYTHTHIHIFWRTCTHTHTHTHTRTHLTLTAPIGCGEGRVEGTSPCLTLLVRLQAPACGSGRLKGGEKMQKQQFSKHR